VERDRRGSFDPKLGERWTVIAADYMILICPQMSCAISNWCSNYWAGNERLGL